MQASEGDVNVILVDWSPLAEPLIIQEGNWFYDAAAMNSIDVGNYVGRCLAQLSTLYETCPPNFHLVGFSLGGQLAGMAGRTYREVTGEHLARITGLDPAGPNFFKGNILRDLEFLGLYDKRLRAEDAVLVDILHSSLLLSDWTPMGDLDFYPNGGKLQPDCHGLNLVSFGACSHLAAEKYYVNSVVNATLYPANSCSRPGCVEDDIVSDSPSAFMGEHCWDLIEPSELTGSGLYYVEVNSKARTKKNLNKSSSEIS